MQYGISLLVFVPSTARNGQSQNRAFHVAVLPQCGGLCLSALVFHGGEIRTAAGCGTFVERRTVVHPACRLCLSSAKLCALLCGLVLNWAHRIALIIKPGPQMFQNLASLSALTAGFCSALALVATNKLTETEPPTRILIYNFGLSTVLLTPLCIWAWKPLTAKQWLLLLGVGFSYALTQYLIIQAYRYASATELSPFNYTVVIFSGLSGWLFFGDVPDILRLSARY